MMKLPQAFLRAGVTKTKAKEKVQARINMSAEVAGAGLCPECQKPMNRAMANGYPVLVCNEHRIALPVSDEEFST